MTYIPQTDRLLVTVFSDNGDHKAEVELKSASELSDGIWLQTVLAPMLENLDGLTFPERGKRLFKAFRAQANTITSMRNSEIGASRA